MVLLIVIALVSCKNETYEMWISIKNGTNDTINCKFYPTPTANGFQTSTEITPVNYMANIYASGNTSQTPVDLLISAYDSISLNIKGYSKTIIFKKGSVKNYKNNPYDNSNSWSSYKITESLAAGFSKTETEITNYFFTINLTDTL
jgi:hypothetical protein